MTNNCLDHGFDGLKDFTNCKNKSHKKSVKSRNP
jgi:hypothetical protein